RVTPRSVTLVLCFVTYRRCFTLFITFFISFSFFFFQAEDGIRDRNVTGVQTCALPICEPLGPDGTARRAAGPGDRDGAGLLGLAHPHRSPERLPRLPGGRAPASAPWRQAAADPVRDPGPYPATTVRDLRQRVPRARVSAL